MIEKKKKQKKKKKMERKLQNLYSTGKNVLIRQDLWQAIYQILLIILLKEFIKLNNMSKYAQIRPLWQKM